MHFRAVIASLVAASTVALHAGQEPPPAVAVYPTTFEVASIRQNVSGDPGSGTRRQPGGRFTTTNVTLRQLLTLAFQVQGFQLLNEPDWVTKDRWDIAARLDADPPPMPPGSPNDPMVVAVRNLLIDRFNLVTRRDTREMDIYALMMASPGGKPGPALRPTAQDCERLLLAAAKGGTPPPAAPGAPVLCGIRTGFGRVSFGGSPLGMFTNALSNPLGRIVVDRTGLAGRWDFELTFAPDASTGTLPPGQEPPPIDPNAPNLFTAVREQLGLKLEPARGPVDVVVIESVQRPTPD